MPYTPQHRERTRERIVRNAAVLIRRRGALGAGIDGIMSASGLTPGGFYAHFRKKDALVSTIVADGLDALSTMLLARLENTDGVPFLATLSRRYLSRRHRDDVDGGCIIAALLNELPRQSPEVRSTFTVGLREMIDHVSVSMPVSAKQTPRDRTLATLALFVGGIMLSRAVDDAALSNRILVACRRFAVPEAYEHEAHETTVCA